MGPITDSFFIEILFQLLFKVGKEVFFLFLLGFLNGGYFTGMLLPGALEFLKGFPQPVFLFFCGDIFKFQMVLDEDAWPIGTFNHLDHLVFLEFPADVAALFH